MIAFALSLFARLMVAAATDDSSFCGFRRIPEDRPASASAFSRPGGILDRRAPIELDMDRVWPPLEINVYVHLVAGSQTSSPAYHLKSTIVRKQFLLLNSHFAGANITFRQRFLERRIYPVYAIVRDGSHQAFIDMALALNQGTDSGNDTLNVYIVDELSTTDGIRTGGQAFYPVNDPEKNLKESGVWIAVGTTPGGDRVNYNLGGTLTHEVGHWFGLPHTWADGSVDMYRCRPKRCKQCDLQRAMGTAPQAYRSTGCPSEQPPDTCPGDSKPDAIHNHMGGNSEYVYSRITTIKEK
ncbi:hypothetical protein CDD83_2870 [Cordyceps sp. RAO-2017]|nr:hypothetical protein CDD83_2870 [Cordyceps sp. RAO-2017]